MSTDNVSRAPQLVAQTTGCVPHADHTVQLYTTDNCLLRELSRWIAPALNAGESAVVIATESHRAGLEELLRREVADFHYVIDEGRFLALDADDTLARFLRAGWPDALRFVEVIGPAIDSAKAAARSSHPKVFAFGEMVARLWAEQKYQAANRLEQLWNELAHSRGFLLRCAYPMSHFGSKQGDGARFLKLCGEHAGVIPAEFPSDNDTAGRRPRRILSVSTNARMLITRNDSLAVAGYSVASPKEPEDAAFLLATQPFDVIVIAESVRQKRRTALIHALRSIRPDVPIVFVYSGPETVAEPLADMTVDVRSGPLALISALERQTLTVRRVA